jgi:hypothetical protein
MRGAAGGSFGSAPDLSEPASNLLISSRVRGGGGSASSYCGIRNECSCANPAGVCATASNTSVIVRIVIVRRMESIVVRGFF